MPAKECPGTVGYLLVQVCKSHRSSIGAALAALGLHPGQEMILMQLWSQDGLIQSQKER